MIIISIIKNLLGLIFSSNVINRKPTIDIWNKHSKNQYPIAPRTKYTSQIVQIYGRSKRMIFFFVNDRKSLH